MHHGWSVLSLSSLTVLLLHNRRKIHLWLNVKKTTKTKQFYIQHELHPVWLHLLARLKRLRLLNTLEYTSYLYVWIHFLFECLEDVAQQFVLCFTLCVGQQQRRPCQYWFLDCCGTKLSALLGSKRAGLGWWSDGYTQVPCAAISMSR